MKKNKKFFVIILSAFVMLINVFTIMGCGGGLKADSKNLGFSLSEDGTYYALIDVMKCEDKEIVIPSLYEGLPVKEIRSFSTKGSFDRDPERILREEGKSLVIPASVTKINEEAFLLAVFVSIEVDKKNENYASIDGNLYTKDEKRLIKFAQDQSYFVIPDGVERIENYAFEGSWVSLLSIPVSVTSIGQSAFYNNLLDTSTIDFIEFKGTIAQWEAIEKYPTWHYGLWGVSVSCSDGTVEIEKPEF